jgi:hypothetical protein
MCANRATTVQQTLRFGHFPLRRGSADPSSTPVFELKMRFCNVLQQRRSICPFSKIPLFTDAADFAAASRPAADRHHRQEIEADFRRGEDLAQKLRPLFPSKLQKKLRG